MEPTDAQAVGVTGRRARWQVGQHLPAQTVTEPHHESLPRCCRCKSATQNWVVPMLGVLAQDSCVRCCQSIIELVYRKLASHSSIEAGWPRKFAVTRGI